MGIGMASPGKKYVTPDCRFELPAAASGKARSRCSAAAGRTSQSEKPCGFGSKFNHQDMEPQVLVLGSIYQGSILGDYF